MQNPSFNILFICRHNAVRSQIAAALAVKIGHDSVSASSAGVEPEPVPDYVNQWVSELNGEPTTLTPTPMDEFELNHFDLIITLCDKTHRALPSLAQDKEHIQWDFPHPNNAEELSHFEIEMAERLRLMLLAKHVIS